MGFTSPRESVTAYNSTSTVRREELFSLADESSKLSSEPEAKHKARNHERQKSHQASVLEGMMQNMSLVDLLDLKLPTSEYFHGRWDKSSGRMKQKADLEASKAKLGGNIRKKRSMAGPKHHPRAQSTAESMEPEQMNSAIVPSRPGPTGKLPSMAKLSLPNLASTGIFNDEDAYVLRHIMGGSDYSRETKKEDMSDSDISRTMSLRVLSPFSKISRRRMESDGSPLRRSGSTPTSGSHSADVSSGESHFHLGSLSPAAGSVMRVNQHLKSFFAATDGRDLMKPVLPTGTNERRGGFSRKEYSSEGKNNLPKSIRSSTLKALKTLERPIEEAGRSSRRRRASKCSTQISPDLLEAINEDAAKSVERNEELFHYTMSNDNTSSENMIVLKSPPNFSAVLDKSVTIKLDEELTESQDRPQRSLLKSLGAMVVPLRSNSRQRSRQFSMRSTEQMLKRSGSKHFTDFETVIEEEVSPREYCFDKAGTEKEPADDLNRQGSHWTPTKAFPRLMRTFSALGGNRDKEEQPPALRDLRRKSYAVKSNRSTTRADGEDVFDTAFRRRGSQRNF
mmetsp:Transcript_12448/g.37960  ORF Transcript_12448/g.37960 Transcript_12448/m.37960 type:complete len:565 (+) Transcript_12448:159-1853(+)|eukprot:CAMPEP_0198726704 /NCGR_PEP_ID=MMETSP1475-20131203/3671_1 /TAXON_ID= ORGANISM="Unidentified sp., Strain CCMP1999" /NCGR_SAMPLE_ID=MMETSP1475 /ASSEMBLY_ACC=CAM_ASM_001111 /LENGTH=564 /DNA_ID=CAMNT_0044488659 /DNA_START=150 /DNA_END=1844 /DNA_ORIENTATION=-